MSQLISKLDPVVPGFPKKIGGVTVNNPVWLAPLAGITFASLRGFYKELGAGLVHTEMVSALGLYHNGRKTKELLYGDESEKPVVLQLFGSNASDISRGAEIALKLRFFDALQVNMACPMPKVTKKGSGSKLMEFPDEAARIIYDLKKFGLPVWSKIRLISSDDTSSTHKFCEKLFNSGCDYIFVHGRTPAQRYEGMSSREKVGEIANRFNGLIGGSGDCYTPEDFEEYLNLGCTSVLAARGILKDVFMIPKTLKKLGADIDTQFIEPDDDFQSELLLKLGRKICKVEGESFALVISRRMMAALFKGFPGASQFRRKGAMLRSWEEMELLIENRKEILTESYTEYKKEEDPI
ncbi:MAG: tRNA-dihydrouridine synthase family protein [Synergistaceae bacterium]